MIQLLRKIRKSLLAQSKFSNYFFYAIGEIILVVIGILLALQINNWNEHNKNKKELDQILTIIAQDLQTDLDHIAESIVFYEQLDSFLMDIITKEYPESYFDSVNAENYLESIHSVSRISIGRELNIQQRGINLLQQFVENKNISEKDLSQEISQFYTTEVNSIIKLRQIVSSFARENFMYLEQFPWFKDYIVKKYNPETVRFFANDPMYKNKAASFLTIAVRTYLRDLKIFKNGAMTLIEKIEDRK